MATKCIINSSIKNANTLSINTANAPLIWSNLNGIINVYKPPGISIHHVRSTVMGNICRDLNELNVRPPSDIVSIDERSKGEYSVKVLPNFADHTLVVGPRYQMEDIRMNPVASLGRNTSGVLLFGVNNGCQLASFLHWNRPTRSYHLVGKLGEATETHFANGKIIEKATFHKIRRSNIDTLLASMQASHQKQMFEQSGVDLQSQAAYELALKGPIRPANNKLPVLYGIKCIDFSPPYFTLEVQCVNEYEQYLATIIHEIGYQLRSVAHCTKIRCLRHGHFSIDNSLLRRHWSLQGIMSSITESKILLDKHPYMLKQHDARLR